MDGMKFRKKRKRERKDKVRKKSGENERLNEQRK